MLAKSVNGLFAVFIACGLLTGCDDATGSTTCGDGVAEGNEPCDGMDIRESTCSSEGFTGGTLACTDTCELVTSGCFTAVCGNGTLEGTEQCDGAALGGQSCETLGHTGGALACSASCTFDESSCTDDPPSCGNGVQEGGEDCDDTDLNGMGCADLAGFNGGTLACNTSCSFDTSGCTIGPLCGNGAQEGDEDCDGADLDGTACTDLGYTGGTLSCDASCAFDESACTAPPNEAPIVTSFNLEGQQVQRGSLVTITVQASDSDGTITSATADLSELGGSVTATMTDDGLGADATALDGIYSLHHTIAAMVLAGAKSITFAATDDQGLTGTLQGGVVISNLPPTFIAGHCSALNSDGASGPVFGPGEELVITADVTDDASVAAVTADLSQLGGSSAIGLTYNSSSARWELSYTGLESTAPVTDAIITITATDIDDAPATLPLTVSYKNWAGIAGSATLNGIATPDGWAMDSDLAVDSSGNLYAGFSQRQDVDPTIASSGWSYFAWIKQYDVNTQTWSELDGSATQYGLSQTSNGPICMSYILEMKSFNDDLYVLFKGDANVGPSDTNFQLFMKRWSATNLSWESLGSVHPSDYVDPAGNDAGGITRKGAEAVRYGDFTIDPLTGDVYVFWMEDTVSSSSNDGLYMRVWRAATDAWKEVAGSASNDGFTDDHLNKYEHPRCAYHNGKIFFVFTKQVLSTGDDYGLAINVFDIASGVFGTEVWIENDPVTRSYKPEISISPSDGRLFVIWYEKKQTPTSYEVRVKTATQTGWTSNVNWTAPGGAPGNLIISMPNVTSVSVLEPIIEVDSTGNAWAVWNTKDTDTTNNYQTWAKQWDAVALQWKEVYLSASSGGVAKNVTVKNYMASMTLDGSGVPFISYDTFYNDPNSTNPFGTGANSDRKIHVKTIR